MPAGYTRGAVVVPVPGVGFSVSGARSPWGALPSMSLDVGRVRMTNVPSELCPTVAIGVIRGFDRVVINGNVAHDAGLTPISQSQILAWCAATPTLTFEVFLHERPHTHSRGNLGRRRVALLAAAPHGCYRFDLDTPSTRYLIVGGLLPCQLGCPPDRYQEERALML
jgi:hypothetical protein